MSIASSFASLRPSLLLDFANSKAVDPRITFSRSTTGKFYDGVTTAKAEENLLLRSQEFDNASWTKSNATITANAATAPDGTTTAEELVEDSSTSAHGLYQLPANVGTQTFSAFLKQNTRSWGALRVDGVSTFFDLATGVVGTVGAGCTAVITSVGGGWYRCAVTKTWGSAQNAWIRMATADTVESYTGDGTSGIYIWGAQLEARSQATAYTPTTTQPITNYIPVLQTAAAGVPRIDHNPVTGECLGLLIEAQRTNLLSYSEQFDNAYWTKTATTISANTSIAPDGALTSDSLVENTANTTHFAARTIPVTSGTTYTLSLFAKTNGRNISLFATSTTNLGGSFGRGFDLTSGTLTAAGNGYSNASSSSITAVGNGWYRCSITVTAIGTGNADFGFWTLGSGGAGSYTGDGYSGIYIWGAQLEAGAFPTSQITTVATQETRNADAASMTGTNFSSWFNNGEGTLYAEASPASVTGAQNQGVTSLNDGTSSNRMSIQTLVANQMSYRYVSSSGNFASTAVSFPAGSNPKTAIAYKASDQAGSVNGTLITGITNQSVVPTVTRLQIGDAVGVSSANGHIRKIAYYPQRLTNANLQALTA